MSKKIVLSFNVFKIMTGNGSSVPLINFLTKQKVGKVEFTTEPWDHADDFTSPELKTKYGGNQIAKWVIDLEKGTFTKFNNGKISHTEKLEIGELVSEIVDLIKLDSKNKYSNVTVYRRTSIPNYQSKSNLKEIEMPKKLPNTFIVKMPAMGEYVLENRIFKNKSLNLKSLVNKIIKEELSRSIIRESEDIEITSKWKLNNGSKVYVVTWTDGDDVTFYDPKMRNSYKTIKKDVFLNKFNPIKEKNNESRLRESPEDNWVPDNKNFYISYYATVGGHGEGDKFKDFKSAYRKGVSLLKDKNFMDGLEYVAVEPSHSNDKEFAIIFATDSYLKKVNSNWFKNPKNYSIYKNAMSKCISSGKPVIGKYAEGE